MSQIGCHKARKVCLWSWSILSVGVRPAQEYLFLQDHSRAINATEFSVWWCIPRDGKVRKKAGASSLWPVDLVTLRFCIIHLQVKLQLHEHHAMIMQVEQDLRGTPHQPKVRLCVKILSDIEANVLLVQARVPAAWISVDAGNAEPGEGSGFAQAVQRDQHCNTTRRLRWKSQVRILNVPLFPVSRKLHNSSCLLPKPSAYVTSVQLLQKWCHAWLSRLPVIQAMPCYASWLSAQWILTMPQRPRRSVIHAWHISCHAHLWHTSYIFLSVLHRGVV